MTKTRKITATLPGGIIAERRTARTYTHVVAVRDSYENALARAQEEGKLYASGAEYYLECIRVGAGGTYREDPEKARRSRPHDPRPIVLSVDECMVSSARENLGECKTVEEYVEKKRAEAVSRVERKKLDGGYDAFYAASWCGRPDLAQKELSQRQGQAWIAEAVIVPVNV